MKKFILTLFCLLLVPGVALAGGSGVYLEPKLFYGFTVMDTTKGHYPGGKIKSDDDDSVFGGGLAAGYNFDKKFGLPVRAELEISYFSEAESSFSKRGHKAEQDLEIGTLFANAYWDIKNASRFTPYVGGGIGLAYIDSDGKVDGRSLGSKDTINFAWNLGAGVGMNLTSAIDLSLGYRFAYLGDAKTKSSGGYRAKSEDIYMHQIGLGLRFSF